MATKVFWQPAGFTLDQIGSKRLIDISDGDTPNIRMNVRLLSVDTPESSPMGLKVGDAPALFAELADWIAGGSSPVEPALAGHLVPRLRRADGVEPFAHHRAQGQAAKAAFKALVARRLRRPSGSLRPLFVRVADQPFDSYGRLLAYVAPEYAADERRTLSRRERATFNLELIDEGWAAPFVIFPSIPGEDDLPLLQAAGRDAVTQRRGAWADPLALAGYEFRACARLVDLMRKVKGGRAVGEAEWTGWIDRYCADLSTARLYAPQDYVRVEPWNRLFVWAADTRRAVAELNLEPAGRLAGE